ncbi:MAG: hypothetical protein HZA93_15110 [Verrucomicrobia bacterium]|nr:hypothetical protein [Verrucomicrobiota bacterium]
MSAKTIAVVLLLGGAVLANEPKLGGLVAHFNDLTVSIMLELPESAKGGLRSTMLYTARYDCIEPHIHWLDGTPVSSDAKLTADSMSSLIEVISSRGLLKRASEYYSNGTLDPKGAPPAERHINTFFKQTRPTPAAILKLNFREGDFHRYYVVQIGWNDELVPLLAQLRTAELGPTPRSLLLDLMKTWKRFR